MPRFSGLQEARKWCLLVEAVVLAIWVEGTCEGPREHKWLEFGFGGLDGWIAESAEEGVLECAQGAWLAEHCFVSWGYSYVLC